MSIEIAFETDAFDEPANKSKEKIAAWFIMTYEFIFIISAYDNQLYPI